MSEQQRPQQTRQPPPDLKMQNLTREELKKIEKSMKKPQFMGLLNEYMIQISDPKNKNQYDQYLKQMERQNELPKHMKIVQIKPVFCFRTFIVSQKNKKHEMKFFINMCESEYLEKPSCDPQAGQDGKVGYHWKIPNTMGKIRYDQDKHGSPCQVVDIAFHPDTFKFAFKKEFQEMIISIALEAAERQLGERKETLSRDYVILQKLKCKGQDGKPALLPIRYIGGKMYNKGEGPGGQQQRDTQGKETKLQKQLNKQKQQHLKEKKTTQKTTQNEQMQEDPQGKSPLVVQLDQGLQRPKYKSIYTYPIDYSEFIDDPMNAKTVKTPSAFNIEFAIPRVQTRDEITSLEINDKKILLKIGEKYFIDLQFDQFKMKYVLLTANAKSKYDSKKKVLRVIIPIDQTIKYHPEPPQQQQIQEIPQQTPQQIQPQPNVVEEETWKHKVLEFSQPGVSIKMLQNRQEPLQQQKKLIEEIDQDDIIEDKQPEKKYSKVKEEEDNQTQPPKPTNKFSLKNYKKKDQTPVDKSNKSLQYIFQETAEKIVLVIKVSEDLKSQIKFIYNKQKKNDFLIYRQQESNTQTEQISFIYLKIDENYQQKVESIEYIERKDFVSIVINKTKEEKGKYWEKASIQQIKLENNDAFFKLLQEITNLNKPKEILPPPTQFKEQIIDENPLLNQQSKDKKTQQNIKPQSNHVDTNPQAKADKYQISQKLQQQGKENIMGHALQPQFLIFDVPFIDDLD